MFKRAASLFLCFVIIFTMLPLSVFAAEPAYSGSCGNGVTWKIVDEVLIISGSGEISDRMYYMNSGHGWNVNYDSNQLPFTSVVIEPGITRIGECAFMFCDFTSISIPNTVTSIGDYAFSCVDELTEIRIPDGVTHIGREGLAISGCNIYLPKSLEFVGYSGLRGDVDKRNYVYYEGTKSDWYDIRFMDKDPYSDYINMSYVSFYYNCTVLSMNGFFIGSRFANHYNYIGDPHIYQSDSPTPKNENYYHLLDDRCSYEPGCSYADITWTSSDSSVLRIEPTNDKVPLFHGVSTGTATVTAKNPLGEAVSFDVTVIDPTGLELSTVYDSNQYFDSGAFYSAVSSLSDSVDIFLKLGNVSRGNYPAQLPDGTESNTMVFENVTVEAVVSGSDLSFEPDSYQNTYTASYGTIDFGTTLADLLTLYPADPDNYSPGDAGKAYTVTITVNSDTFRVPVVETVTFTILDAETYLVDTHVQFATKNGKYIASKSNNYGKNMAGLKDDPEFIWSKWSTLDFENYYEVAMADLLIGMLDIPQADFTIVPKVLKKWYGGYKSLVSSISNIVKEDYASVLDISETKINKVIKSSKYLSGDEVFADDALYQTVMKVLGSSANAEKVQNAFKKVDNSLQVFKLVSLATDPIKEFVAWGNTLGVLNAFDEADEELKEVFRALADEIPDSEHDMKEAVLDYVNFSHDYSGKVQEIFDTFFEASKDMTAASFKNIIGKRFWDWTAIKAVEWIGKIPLKDGTKLASTKVYSTLTSATSKAIAGSVLTGVSIGLTISDLICDSSTKASETGKLIAMSEYSPYIVEVLQKYEDNLLTARNKESVLLFENAFHLHQAAQSYIMNQTSKVLMVKGESILQRILGNEEYLKVAADTLVHKQAIDELACCTPLTDETVVHNTKVIVVRCPVSVYLYDEAGNEIVRIVSDSLEYAAEGIAVYLRDGEKFIAVPANQKYSIKIIATDSGSMDYTVMEYGSDLQAVRILERADIPLVLDRIFTGAIDQPMDIPFESYALSYESKLYVPLDPEIITGRRTMHMLRMYDPNSGEHFYTGSTVERDNLVAAGWNYEGVGFTFPMNAGDPVHRLYDPVYGEHLYTMDQEEVDKLLAEGWNYEGIAFNSASKYEVPQYRLHNPNAKRGAYHFTGSIEERDYLISIGWEYQGIGWYSSWG